MILEHAARLLLSFSLWHNAVMAQQQGRGMQHARFDPTTSTTTLLTARRHLDEEAVDVCEVSTTVFSEEELFLVDTYQPVCDCTKHNSLLNAFRDGPAKPTTNNTDDFAAWLGGFEDDLRTNGWVIEDETACDNTCQVCLEGTAALCGRMTLRERTEVRLELEPGMDFPIENFVALSNQTSDALLNDFNFVRSLFVAESCFDGEDGKLCYAINILWEDEVGVPVSEFGGGGDVSCTITLDGIGCNRCSYDVEEQCFAADCTNLFPGATWSCEPAIEDFVGPFRPLFYNAVDTQFESNFAVGTCRATEAAPATFPTNAPAETTIVTGGSTTMTDPNANAPTDSSVAAVPATASPAAVVVPLFTDDPVTPPTAAPFEATVANVSSSSQGALTAVACATALMHYIMMC